MWSWQCANMETKKAANWLLLFWIISCSSRNGACQHIDVPSISQISPKSSTQVEAENILHLSTSSHVVLESTVMEASTSEFAPSEINHIDNESRQLVRVERSALPILNENFAKSGHNDINQISDTHKEVMVGRYFQYNIKPTETLNTFSENPQYTTQRARTGKTLQTIVTTSSNIRNSDSKGATRSNSNNISTTKINSFLVQGDLRPIGSGSPITPTSSSAFSRTTASTATAATMMMSSHNPRQNSNPDIQDIITGIVKLLNGNVNVHANTQGPRRPTASRINNRGPPRISDAQTLPIEYEAAYKPSMGTSARPPPYPFDRPERPFITGVPIPEQIVPYRPGFVSNRPPWHRNKPRPPITSMGGRRPIPQYKPLPSQLNSQETEKKPPQLIQQEIKLPTPSEIPTLTEHSEDANGTPTGSDYIDSQNGQNLNENTYDSDFSNEDVNAQYIEVSDQNPQLNSENNVIESLNDHLQSQPLHELTIMSENKNKKKQTNKNKNVNALKKKQTSNIDYTTIIETSSVVHTHIGDLSSTYLPMPMESVEETNFDMDSSTDEVIFMTPSKTPNLDSATIQGINIPAATENPQIKNTTFPASTSTKFEINASESSILSIEKRPMISNDTKPSVFVSSLPSVIDSIYTTVTTMTAIETTTTIATTTDSSKSNIDTATKTSYTNINPLTHQIGDTISPSTTEYHPRPGIVLDDPEFKPGGRPRPQRPHSQTRLPNTPLQPSHISHIQPNRPNLPPGYGEIFDVTLSAIQGPGSGSGSQQTINIRPYGSYGNADTGAPHPQAEVIVSAAGDDGFVSIDGKRTYINLFGDPTDAPNGAQIPSTRATLAPQHPTNIENSTGNSNSTIYTESTRPNADETYGISTKEEIALKPTKPQSPQPIMPLQASTTHSTSARPHYRQRPTQPPVRIDTCIVGDDSTCDHSQNERCKTENGISSCHCKPGYSRRKHREPCRKIISFYIGMRVDRIYEHRIVWDKKLLDHSSEPYGQLGYESIRAIDSAMSMTPYSDEFMEAKVNNIYRGNSNLGGSGVYVNLTVKFDESVETLRPDLRNDVQKHLLGVLHRRNNNIGNSVLYVSSPEGAVSPLQDIDECNSRDLNDCHTTATCTNTWGSFICACASGMRDPWADQLQRAGRECQVCADAYCNNHGTCSYNEEGAQVCHCDNSHYGSQCEIDGEVLGVAIGASVAAVIIIVLTLVCLIMWSRRWQREQKNSIGSPVFGYMNTAPLKSSAITLAQPGYQVTLEDRMRWAQIADVMAQTNHYGAEPIGPTRPSSALFAYPNLQTMSMGTIGGMSIQNSIQMHQNAGANMAPPVPLPRRLGLSARANGMRTLENSSSSEEEDHADLLGQNFQVPRPKSRSNASITNQSGIYYDVDYEPSGNGIGNTSVDHIYGSQNQNSSNSHLHSHGSNSHMPGSQGIPMSTYTSGRASSSYFMK